MLDDKMTAPAEVKVIDDSKYVVELVIGMREGRKRQIRRVAELLGHPVRRLMREKIGPLRMKDIEPGQWRELNERELKSLFKAARIPSPKQRTIFQGSVQYSALFNFECHFRFDGQRCACANR